MATEISNVDIDAKQDQETTKRRVAPLLAARRRNLDRDRWITSHTYTDADGDKIHRIEYEDKDQGTQVIDVNLSRLLSAAPSRTTDVDLLLTEAKLIAEGKELDNPHIPATDQILDEAIAQIGRANDDLTPAWEVVDSQREVVET